MKNLISIFLVSILLIGCGENRVLIDELTNKGTEDSPVMYNEKGLFNGIGFDIFSDGKLKYERNYRDGKWDGFEKRWYWYKKNGQLEKESNYQYGDLIYLKCWDKNGIKIECK